MRYTLTVFFLLLIASCSKQRAALYHFNQVNGLVKKTESSLNTYLQKIGEIINTDLDPDRFNKAELLQEKLTNKIHSYINQTKAIHSLKEDPSYHNASVTYFEGLGTIVDNELKQIIATTAQFPDSASALLTIFQNKRNSYAGEFIKVRDAFAKKHDIILQVNEKTDSEQ
jgi:hypothetical protein